MSGPPVQQDLGLELLALKRLRKRRRRKRVHWLDDLSCIIVLALGKMGLKQCSLRMAIKGLGQTKIVIDLQ